MSAQLAQHRCCGAFVAEMSLFKGAERRRQRRVRIQSQLGCTSGSALRATCSPPELSAMPYAQCSERRGV